MRKLVISVGTVAGALLVTRLASAHAFICDKNVNGMDSLELSDFSTTTTLHYEFIVTNSHETSASTYVTATDDSLASLGCVFESASNTVPLGESISDTCDVDIASHEDCLALAALDGTADDRLVNTFTVTWEGNSTSCSATVVCIPPPPPPEGGPTRTMGYYMTHPGALDQCLASDGGVGGAIDLGFITISTTEDALGLLWGSPAVYETGDKRSKLDKARFLLARQTLVGICNERLFGTEPDPSNLLEMAVSALSGTDCSLMHELQEKVDFYNNSGDDEDSGMNLGPATPQTASDNEDPTVASTDQCTG